MKNKILITGAIGQVGTELTEALQNKFGIENVIASDIKEQEEFNGIYEKLDVLNQGEILKILKKYNIKTVYNLAALLSATAEKNIPLAWKLNMEGHFNFLNLAKEKIIQKIFWPSSIGVFGPSSPKENTPQSCVIEPNTVYGISKLAGERWSEYYYQKFGVDIRSVRYPGLIGYKSLPSGGSTDYAVEIFHEAKKNKNYTCFLSPEITLPMMFIKDAIKATIDIMETNPKNITIRSSYNIASVSFNPKEISDEIKKHIPDFKINYKPDFRQELASSWPKSINDSQAKKDWQWKSLFNLKKLVEIMLKNI